MILTASEKTFLTFTRISNLYGKPFVFPTDTVYGVGSPVASVEANKEIFKIKKRSLSNPLPILAGTIAQVEKLACLPTSKKIIDFVESVWAGTSDPCTLIFKAKKHMHKTIYVKNNTIAIRLIAKGWLKNAITYSGPITATSVNESGKPYLNVIKDIENEFKGRIDFFLKGPTEEKPSSIFDISEEKIIQLR